MALVIVVGMASEAAIVGTPPGIQVVIGAGDAVALASKLEAAIAAGATSILSLGICGALDPQLQAGTVVVGNFVRNGNALIPCDPVWLDRLFAAVQSLPAAWPYWVVFSWSAVPVASAADKAKMWAATSAEVVDEETWVCARVASKHKIPLAAVRVVLDPAAFDLPPAASERLTSLGGVDLGEVLASIVDDPGQLPELVQLAGYSATAFGNLGAVVMLIGPDFGV
jgi:adenosylhomocysteine nucleosidase